MKKERVLGKGNSLNQSSGNMQNQLLQRSSMEGRRPESSKLVVTELYKMWHIGWGPGTLNGRVGALL